MNKNPNKIENQATTDEIRTSETSDPSLAMADNNPQATSEITQSADALTSSIDPSLVVTPTEIPDTPNESSAPADSERITELETELHRLNEESRSYLDALQRIKAEFDNYKKRISRERQLTEQLIKEEVVIKLLPIIDNLELALKAGQDRSLDTALLEGIALIVQQVTALLNELDITKIVTIDTPFDPNFHEALLTLEREGVASGIIVQEITPGYMMSKRVIRPAKVVVSK